MVLKITIKAIIDTIGENGLIPELLVLEYYLGFQLSALSFP